MFLKEPLLGDDFEPRKTPHLHQEHLPKCRCMYPPVRDDAIIQLMPSCWKAIQSTNSQLRLAALRLAMLMPPEALGKLLKHPGDPTESWVVDGCFEDVFFDFFIPQKHWGRVIQL